MSIMEEFLQFSAKTKNDAITKACIELGTSSDQLEIQVVSEGSTGFFGIGSRPAIIKVRRKTEDPAENELQDILENVSLNSIEKAASQKTKEKKSPEKKPSAEAKPSVKEEKKEEKKEAPAEKSVQVPEKEKPQPKEVKEVKEVKEAKENKEAKPVKEKQPKEKQPREKQPKEQKEKAPKEAKEPREEKASKDKAEVKEKPQKPIQILTKEEEIKEVEQRAVVFLRDVFQSMDLGEVDIKSVYNREEGSLDVDFEGEDMGVLIGKRGQTLDSLQYLTSLVVNKGKDNYIRVKLDTEDYRRRRKETLESLARSIANKVKKTRRPVVLEAMNPYERRIIHSALQNNKYVETVSEGEEPYRHIVVKMKKFDRSERYERNDRNS